MTREKPKVAPITWLGPFPRDGWKKGIYVSSDGYDVIRIGMAGAEEEWGVRFRDVLVAGGLETADIAQSVAQRIHEEYIIGCLL